MIHQTEIGEREVRAGALTPVNRLSLSSREKLDRLCYDPSNLHGSLRIPTALTYGAFKFDAMTALGASDKIPQLLRARVEARMEIDKLMASKKLGPDAKSKLDTADAGAGAGAGDADSVNSGGSQNSKRYPAPAATIADLITSVKMASTSAKVSGKSASGRAPSSMGKLY